MLTLATLVLHPSQGGNGFFQNITILLHVKNIISILTCMSDVKLLFLIFHFLLIDNNEHVLPMSISLLYVLFGKVLIIFCIVH